jgi:hypothetical protein
MLPPFFSQEMCLFEKRGGLTLVVFNLQAVNFKHNKVGETNEPGMYRINDDLVTLFHLRLLSSEKSKVLIVRK